jgi:hypothetical protein
MNLAPAATERRQKQIALDCALWMIIRHSTGDRRQQEPGVEKSKT